MSGMLRASRNNYRNNGAGRTGKNSTMVACFYLNREGSYLLEKAEKVTFKLVDKNDDNIKVEHEIPKFDTGDPEDYLIFLQKVWSLAVAKQNMSDGKL